MEELIGLFPNSQQTFRTDCLEKVEELENELENEIDTGDIDEIEFSLITSWLI
jgi:hypothetical protein